VRVVCPLLLRYPWQPQLHQYLFPWWLPPLPWQTSQPAKTVTWTLDYEPTTSRRNEHGNDDDNDSNDSYAHIAK